MSDAMAAQVDSFNQKILEPFRPWLHRDPPPRDEQRSNGISTFPSTFRMIIQDTSPSGQSPSQPRDLKHNMRHGACRLSFPPPATVSEGVSRLAICQNTTTQASAYPTPTSEGRTNFSCSLSPSKGPASVGLVPSFPPTSSLRLVASSLSNDLTFARSEPADQRRVCLKRRRSVTDIDGPNTATLSCKKRRLRRYLITSRLSQPFSQPATHILNRESIASGDKRFLKLAAIINTRRIVQLPLTFHTASTASSLAPLPLSLSQLPQSPSSGLPSSFSATITSLKMIPVPRPPSPGETLRRFAISNCFRKRALVEVVAGSKVAGLPAQQPKASSPKTWPPITTPPQPPSIASSEVTTFFAGATCPASSWLTTKQPLPTPLPYTNSALTVTDGSFQIMRSAASRLYLDSLGNRALPITICPSQPSVSKAEELLREAAQAGTSHINAANADHSADEDADEDGYCAFPGSQSGDRYDGDDPDPDDVYSDFSVLFRVSEDGSGFGEEGFDDYMDELDGIAHLAR